MHHELPNIFYRLIESKDNVVLLETSKFDEQNDRSLLFTDPIEILQIHSLGEVPGFLNSIEHHVQQGHYLTGYFAYEFGYAFEQIAPLTESTEPIAWFGVYKKPIIFNHRIGTFENDSTDILKAAEKTFSRLPIYKLGEPRFNIPRSKYTESIQAIKNYIRSGDTYQINYTGKYNFDFEGSPLALYNDLKRKQRVSYGAFIKSGNNSVVSLSPELFFRLKDGVIMTKPMKGTIRRGKTTNEDAQLASWLQNDPKNRSENVMIVDLLRNDLGRISETGSVQTEELCAIEQYQTLLQMTSAVTGKLKQNVTYSDIIKNIFPCGSVTGAPKIRSMQIIHELEQRRRGIYTGAIGYFSPNREAIFNVAIRTVVINGNEAEMGVGSGIVYDSLPEQEFSECELKAQFLTAPPQEDFSLFETMLWNNGYPFLSQHLQRLSDSAKYFDYPCDVNNCKDELLLLEKQFTAGTNYRVRLRLNVNGSIILEYTILDANPAQEFIALSDYQVNSSSSHLYHKTSHRDDYNKLYDIGLQENFSDIIVANENSEISEGTRNNILIEKDGKLLTPPVTCGLLNGIYRQHLLNTRTDIIEQTLTANDLHHADAIYLCNAVRGMRKVQLKPARIQYSSPASDQFVDKSILTA